MRVSSLNKFVTIISSQSLGMVFERIDAVSSSWVLGIGGSTGGGRAREVTDQRSTAELLQTGVDLRDLFGSRSVLLMVALLFVRALNLVNRLRAV